MPGACCRTPSIGPTFCNRIVASGSESCSLLSRVPTRLVRSTKPPHALVPIARSAVFTSLRGSLRNRQMAGRRGDCHRVDRKGLLLKEVALPRVELEVDAR